LFCVGPPSVGLLVCFRFAPWQTPSQLPVVGLSESDGEPSNRHQEIRTESTEDFTTQ
jgi:hypothetical protein